MVCKPRMASLGGGFPPATLFLFPNTSFRLPHSLGSAVCQASHEKASDPVVLIAEYLSEDLMQRDLGDNEVKWFCFAEVSARLFVMATRAADRVMGPKGLEVSPVLKPLVHDGFINYSDPS